MSPGLDATRYEALGDSRVVAKSATLDPEKRSDRSANVADEHRRVHPLRIGSPSAVEAKTSVASVRRVMRRA
jgi:hypothetical protein